MKDRIKEIMDNENMTPTRFADKLRVNRAVISHILNGRNNPSLDVVMSILAELPYINSDWLLNGEGSMYKDGFDIKALQSDGDLFSNRHENVGHNTDDSQISKGNRLNEPVNTHNMLVDKATSQEKILSKKISQIIIYYDDNTFETFVINK